MIKEEEKKAETQRVVEKKKGFSPESSKGSSGIMEKSSMGIMSLLDELRGLAQSNAAIF